MMRMFQCFRKTNADGEPSRKDRTSSRFARRSQQLTQSLQCDTSETEDSSVLVRKVSAVSVANRREGVETTTTPDLMDRTHFLSPSDTEVRHGAISNKDDNEEDTPRAMGSSRRQLFGTNAGPKPEEEDPLILLALQAAEKVLEPSSSAGEMAYKKHDASEVARHDGVERPQPGHSRHQSRTLDRSGNDSFEHGDLDQAFVQYEAALQLKRQALRELDANAAEERARALASIATSINNVAFLRHSRGLSSPEATLELYEMALRIKQDILGADHLSVGKTLNNIGSIYFFQKKYPQAAVTYEHAREILQLRLGHDHLDVCTVTANLGDVHCSMKQWDRAVQEYRDALDLRWKLLGPADAKVVRLMEQIAELEMFMNQENALTDGTVKRHERLYGPIIKDVRKLQKELQRDMDDLNILERQMPLEMDREKETVFREMRELSCGQDMDVADAWNLDTMVEGANVLSWKCLKNDDDCDSTRMEDCISVSSSDFPSSSLSRECSYSKSPLNLSDDERKQALASVKERLAAMKAKRESLSPIEPSIVPVTLVDDSVSAFPIQ